MGAGSRVALLVAALVACSTKYSGFGETAAVPREQLMARAYFEEARGLAEAGDWRAAAVSVDAGLALDPSDADLSYLRALSTLQLGSPLAEALGELEAGLASGRFSYYSSDDATKLKAELLVRERRWSEALDAIGPPSAKVSADPAFAIIRIRALALSGQANAFQSEMAAALRRFPDDAAFPRFFLSRVRSLPSNGQRAIGDIILGRLARYAVADPEIPVLAVPLMPDPAARRDAVLAFRAVGGKSAYASLRALEYGILDEASAAAELLSGAFPISLGDLSDLLALAGSPSGREAVRSALAAWSGEVLVDGDGDGISEGRFSIEKGVIARWELDSNQDGIADVVAGFAEGTPVDVTLRRAGADIEASYSAYPAVSSIVFASAGDRRSYVFAPEAISFAPIAMKAFVGEGPETIMFPYPSAAADPSERSCAMAANSVETVAGADREVAQLDRGIPISSVSFKDGRVYSTMAYKQGQPYLERVDADADGRFETERSYARSPDGSWGLAWTRIDADGDGVFEYREQAVYPFTKEWDYDGNGSVDARQRTLADGSISQDFSTRLDGRLDETVVVKAGRIVSFSRNGAVLDLVPDSGEGLFWLGKKPFDLGPLVPQGEGIFSYKGKRYTLTRVGGLAFAELTP